MLKQLFVTATMVVASATAFAQTTPDALVKQISTEVIETAKTDKDIQAGSINKIIALVDSKVMPSVNFEVMTRSAVGPQWRSASADQRQRLMAEFKTLLVRVYAGALTQIKDQKVEITRTQPVQGSTQVVVQSEVRGSGEPIKLDYRMDQFNNEWKIIDVNVGGIWLVQSYRSQFNQVLSNGGVDALITRLTEQNKANNSKS